MDEFTSNMVPSMIIFVTFETKPFPTVFMKSHAVCFMSIKVRDLANRINKLFMYSFIQTEMWINHIKLKYLLKCCNVSLDEVYLKRHNSFNQKSPLRLGTQTDRQSGRKIGRQTDGRTGGYRENSSTIDAVVMLLSCRRGARTVQLAKTATPLRNKLLCQLFRALR